MRPVTLSAIIRAMSSARRSEVRLDMLVPAELTSARSGPISEAAATAVDVGSPIGLYRVRGNIGTACPTSVNIRWVPAAGSNAPFATESNYPVRIIE